MQAQDLYVRLDDPSGQRTPVVNYHRVWDRQLFITSQKQQYEVKAKPGDLRSVSVVTEGDYNAFRKGELK